MEAFEESCQVKQQQQTADVNGSPKITEQAMVMRCRLGQRMTAFKKQLCS